MLAANEAVATSLGGARRSSSSAAPTPTPSRSSSTSSPSSPAAWASPSTSRRAGSSSSASSTRDDRQAGGVRGPLRVAPQPEAGQLHARSRGALRAGERRTIATSPRRSAGTPTCRCIASSSPGSKGRSPSNRHGRADRPGRALHPHRAAGRGGRARADPHQAPHLPGEPHRRFVPRGHRGRPGFRVVLPPGGAAGRGPDPRHVPGGRLLLPGIRHAHPGRPQVGSPPSAGRPRRSSGSPMWTSTAASSTSSWTNRPSHGPETGCAPERERPARPGSATARRGHRGRVPSGGPSEPPKTRRGPPTARIRSPRVRRKRPSRKSRPRRRRAGGSDRDSPGSLGRKLGLAQSSEEASRDRPSRECQMWEAARRVSVRKRGSRSGCSPRQRR